MRKLKDRLQDQIKEVHQNREAHIKKELETIQPEVEAIRAMIKARLEQGLTQKDLAERIGMDQADISKLENGNANPSLRTLRRLAQGMGMQMKIEFVPTTR